jgi:hypothetical protein
MRVIIDSNKTGNQVNIITVNHILRQFSGLGYPLARVCLSDPGVRHLSLVTGTPQFQPNLDRTCVGIIRVL